MSPPLHVHFVLSLMQEVEIIGGHDQVVNMSFCTRPI